MSLKSAFYTPVLSSSVCMCSCRICFFPSVLCVYKFVSAATESTKLFGLQISCPVPNEPGKVLFNVTLTFVFQAIAVNAGFFTLNAALRPRNGPRRLCPLQREFNAIPCTLLPSNVIHLELIALKAVFIRHLATLFWMKITSLKSN